MAAKYTHLHVFVNSSIRQFVHSFVHLVHLLAADGEGSWFAALMTAVVEVLLLYIAFKRAFLYQLLVISFIQ